jgi:alkylated DNA repair dioxygenase AlkB
MNLVAPADYIPGFVQDADYVFKTLREDLAWIRHDKVPRSEYYVNNTMAPYKYGDPRFARTYEPQSWHPILREHQTAVSSRLNANLDVCFLNMYEDGKDQLGWHADDSPEMDPFQPIVSVSFGEEREIMVRPNEIQAKRMVEEHMLANEGGEMTAEQQTELFLVYRKPEIIMLEHGSMFVMRPGMQQTHEHRIPKSSKHICGPRISETWRHYLEV